MECTRCAFVTNSKILFEIHLIIKKHNYLIWKKHHNYHSLSCIVHTLLGFFWAIKHKSHSSVVTFHYCACDVKTCRRYAIRCSRCQSRYYHNCEKN